MAGKKDKEAKSEAPKEGSIKIVGSEDLTELDTSKVNGQQSNVFKVTPKGDGGLYGWKEFDEAGNIVSESQQTWPTEADAEKAIRVLVPTSSTVEVTDIKNINPEANTNVQIVKEDTRRDENAGMEVVDKSVEDRPATDSEAEAQKKEADYHDKITADAKAKHDKLVAEGKHPLPNTPEAGNVSSNNALPTPKEQ